jgi:hypothetical protein
MIVFILFFGTYDLTRFRTPPGFGYGMPLLIGLFSPALPQIQALMDMGFARDSAEAALVASNDDVEEAVLYMLASIAPDVGASGLAYICFCFVLWSQMQQHFGLEDSAFTRIHPAGFDALLVFFLPLCCWLVSRATFVNFRFGSCAFIISRPPHSHP